MAWHDTYRAWLSEAESLENAQLVADHFTGSDWSKEAISALCGNMREESSINPNMYEYGYDWAEDRGFGLVQWTPRSKYWGWATNNNLAPRHGDSQLARIDYEVDNNIQWIPISDYNNMTFADFRQNAGSWSVDYLTEAFTWCYERPNQQAGEDSMPARKAFANTVFNQLTFGGNCDFIYPTTKNVTSGFRTSHRPDHFGVDFADGADHPIKASAGGTVSRSYVSTTYGEVVYIVHTIDGQDYETVYAHLETGSRTVTQGDSVEQGDIIGQMGNTGASEGKHLHFELHIPTWNSEKSNAVDPMDYLCEPGTTPPQPPTSGKEYLYFITNRHNTNMRRR